MVSKLSIVFIVINMVLGILIPIVLLVYFKKKYKASIKSFFVGCGVMLVFAFLSSFRVVLSNVRDVITLNHGILKVANRSPMKPLLSYIKP